MFCPKCGSEIPEAARFCRKCGTPIRRCQTAQSTDTVWSAMPLPSAASIPVVATVPVIEPKKIQADTSSETWNFKKVGGLQKPAPYLQKMLRSHAPPYTANSNR